MIKLENWEFLGVVCEKNYSGLIFYRKAVTK